MVFSPKFFHLFKKGRYSRERFISDLIAGVVVGIIALPLAIAFGIASGVSPQQGLIHAAVLLLIYLFLMPYAVYIPLSCLAAILVVVAFNMSEWRSFRYLLKGDAPDVAVLLITFFLTVIVDLTVGIEVGVVLAIAMFVRRMMQTSTIEVLDQEKIAAAEDDGVAAKDDVEMLDIHKGVEVYEINGPYFFGLASRSEEFERRNKDTRVRIIRMRKVPFIDSTGVNNLKNIIDMAHKRGVEVILSGVNGRVLGTLRKFGVDELIGEGNIYPNIFPALAHANDAADRFVEA